MKKKALPTSRPPVGSIEEVKPLAKPVLKIWGWFNSGNIIEALSDSYLNRDQLPEPWDFPSHVGNFREGAMGAVTFFVMAGIFALPEKTREKFSRNAKKVALGAFAASSAVQVIGEKYELTNGPFVPNTGDPIDAAYGIAWSAVSAYGAYRAVKTFEQEQFERVSNYEDDPHSDLGPEQLEAQSNTLDRLMDVHNELDKEIAAFEADKAQNPF